VRLFGIVDNQITAEDRAFFGFMSPFDMGLEGLTATAWVNYAMVKAGKVLSMAYKPRGRSKRDLRQ